MEKDVTAPRSDKMRLFPDAYVAANRNACRAALDVGYSPASARMSAERCMRDPWVLARIAELDARDAAKFEATRENVLREFARIGFSDIRKIFRRREDGEGVELVPVPELDDDTAAAISRIKFMADGSLEYKLWPKDSALTNLARNLGLFEKDNRQGAADVIAQLMQMVQGSSVGPGSAEDDAEDEGDLPPALRD